MIIKSENRYLRYMEKKSKSIIYDLEEIVKKASSVIDNRSNKIEPYSKVFFTYVDSFTFDARDKIVQDINFNISSDNDFIAKRFSLYLRRRIENPNAVVSVAPKDVFESSCFNFQARPVRENILSVDCVFELSESITNSNGLKKTRSLQNVPIPVSMSFGGNNNRIGSPSSKVFDVDWEIKKGSNIQCKITVTNSIDAGTDLSIPDKLKIIGTLSGFKKIKNNK